MTDDVKNMLIDHCVHDVSVLVDIIDRHISDLEDKIEEAKGVVDKIIRTSSRRYNGSPMQRIMTRIEISAATDLYDNDIMVAKNFILSMLDDLLKCVTDLYSTLTGCHHFFSDGLAVGGVVNKNTADELIFARSSIRARVLKCKAIKFL